MTLLRTIPSQNSSFEDQAADRLRNLKGALAALFAAAPGEIRRPVDIQNVLGLPHTLSWQIHQVASSADPLAVVTHVPKPKAMSRVLDAARTQGLPTDLIESVAQAYEAFESFVEHSAGDRPAFESITSGLGTLEQQESVDVHHRRAAFRAGCHIWGVHVQTRLSCAIFSPSEDPAFVDAVQIHGNVGYHRLRSDAKRVLARARAVDDAGKAFRHESIEPIDLKTHSVHKAPILGEFSSDVMKRLSSVEGKDGFMETTLADDEVGKASAVTYFLGEVYRNASTKVKSDAHELIQVRSGVGKPTEVLIHDVLVREGTFGSITPEAKVYGGLVRGGSPDDSEAALQRLPQHVSAVYLGKGPAMLSTPDVPRYSEMVKYALERLGWDGDRFDVFRCRVEFPVNPSTVVVWFPLPR